MKSDQVKKLMRSPEAMARFRMTGQLPQGVKPKSPLITLLEAINPGDRGRIVGVRVGPELGYNGSRQFHTAAQALRWAKPKDEVFDSFPAASWQMGRFQKKLTIDDLAEQCANMPGDVLERYPHLRRAGIANSQPPSPSPKVQPNTSTGSDDAPVIRRPKP